MIRFTHLVSLSAVVALAACTSKSDNAADTTAMADTSAGAMSSTATMPADTSGMASTTASTTASSTGAITKIDLNTATDAQILAIPGMGPRMLREFKEYRPYTSMDQFRREIGKYVDKAELARLEQYVYIKK
ncbi:MAG TPA: hypothetical protein VFK26_03525 [Gemmatimonadaceae bacterium]|nr:hypothetical protein [Gemmatimonadaceae bacterium]